MTKNRYIILLISLALILASLACSLQAPARPLGSLTRATQTADGPATVQPTATPALIVITASVWLRDYSGSKVGALVAGDTVAGWCAGDWCYLPGGKVWRGCTDQADGRGCEQR